MLNFSPAARRRLEDSRLWLGLALLLRLAFALKLGGRYYQTDEAGFAVPALQLARTGVLGVGGRALALPPVPTGFFALFFQLGDSLLWPRLGQALVGTLIVWLMGAMTERVTGSRPAGRLALALSAVYPFFVYYGGMLMSETLDLALVIPGLWWLCAALERRGAQAARLAAGAGLALGLSALCRAENAYVAPLFWAAAALLCLSGRWSWRAWAFAVAMWLLPLLGWCARNRAQTGSFSLDQHGGISMLHGTEFFDLNEVDTGLAIDAINRTPWAQAARTLSEGERDKVYKREALEWMRSHKRQVVGQWFRKLWNFWRPIPRLDKSYAESDRSHPSAGAPRWALALISALFEPWLILLGFAGLWGLRGRWRALFPLYIWVGAVTAMHVLTVAQLRYRLAVMPVLILAACWLLAERLSSPRSGSV